VNTATTIAHGIAGADVATDRLRPRTFSATAHQAFVVSTDARFRGTLRRRPDAL
jgi:hypothetical protein